MARRAVVALLAVVGVGVASIGTWVVLAGRPADRDAVVVRVAGAPAASAPSSLRGTTPDGGARATADDTLVLTPELIRLFEYYLTTVGERPLGEIRAQIERDLDGRLGPNAARQAKDVLARYLLYREAMKSVTEAPAPAVLAASGPAVERLRRAYQAMRDARSRFFTPVEVAALFGPDDAMAQAALDRLTAVQDPAASPEERRRRLAALDQASPAAAEAREASNLVNRLNDDTRRLRAEGGTEDDVYRMRAAATSPEAANRLAELDRDEARWSSRIADYLQQRAALLAAPDPDTAVAQLRARLFTPEEQRRLAAYEH